MNSKPALILIVLQAFALTAFAGAANDEQKEGCFFSISSGFSKTQDTSNLNLQGGLSLSKAPVRWGYQLGFGILSKEYHQVTYGFEVTLSQYTKNKWLFSPLISQVEQDIKGIEVKGRIDRHLARGLSLVVKGGPVWVRQNMKATNVFNNPTRFTFQYLGHATKVKPIVEIALGHDLTTNSQAFISYSHIFSSRQASVTALSGPAPTLFSNASWRNPPGLNNLVVGLLYLFH